MPARLPISNFSRGEFGPQLYGRVDIPQYNAGAKQLLNFVVQRYGGARFRDGFRFVAPIMEDDITKVVKLVPFQYSIEQSYVLVMRDKVMNDAALGGMVLEEDLKIVSATYGATTTLEIKFHNMLVGQWLWLEGNTGPAELVNRFVKIIQVVDQHHVKVNIDTTGAAPLTASTGTNRSSNPAPPPTPEPPPPPPPPPPTPPVIGSGGGTPGPGPGGSGIGGDGGYHGPPEGGGWYDLP